jgi:hypothetical protein
MTKLHTDKWNFKPKCDSSNTNKNLASFGNETGRILGNGQQI